MSKDAKDELRIGIAGVHDVVGRENINLTMKKDEEIKRLESIFIDAPETFQRGVISVSLIQLPHDERSGTAIFPLGLGYLARILRDIGVEINIIDAHAEQLSVEEVVERVNEFSPDFIGISALSTQYGIVKDFSNKIKKKNSDLPIILGAQLAHYSYNVVLNNTLVDVCVIGEGEITIQDLIYNFDTLNSVKGIAFRNESGTIVQNSARQRIKNPDIIPFPAWDLFNMDYYLTAGFFGSNSKRTMNILASRGCPYSCTFCSLSFPNVTYRSSDNVIAEINELRRLYGIDGIIFSDELFVISKKRVLDFCEKIKPLGIEWGGQGRANVVDDDIEFLEKMKDAGAVYIGFGLESATDEILSNMMKKTSRVQNYNAVKSARSVGLKVVAQYMMGFPGESINSINETIEFFKELDYCPPLGLETQPFISLTTALPGSQLYVDCVKNGLIKNEDEYLEKITTGYFYNKDVVVNLTDFSDEELLGYKMAAEQEIYETMLNNAIKNNPFFVYRFLLERIFREIQLHGITKTAVVIRTKLYKLLMKFLHNPKSIFDKSNLLPSMQSDYITRVDYRRLLRNELKSMEND
ncbi:B12-binding domain-containing radical SAM protein [Planktomarina temperata]|nr:B12-binding domain-containing radical SAM protein [Planktomarina temperata]